MATAIELGSRIPDIVSDVYQRNEESENNRFKEYGSAVLIQSWFRATRIRCYLKLLHNNAITIQRHWRSYMGRARVRGIIIETLYKMRMARYNEMATLVQKMWRGYYTRKYVFNYYSRKRYLAALQEKNTMIREELQEYEETIRKTEHKEQNEGLQQERIKWARNHHHLVSTLSQPGIFNSPFANRPKSQEEALRAIKHPVIPHKACHKKDQPTAACCPPTEGFRFDPAWVDYDHDRPTRLPPLPAHKPQGPFREPPAVREQRYRPLNPSLRVMTDFYSVEKAREVMRDEEWTKRIFDDKFIPAGVTQKAYERMLNSTIDYGHLPYGTRHFREVQPEQHITSKSFQTVVPPIYVFDKLNKQYHEGYVEN